MNKLNTNSYSRALYDLSNEGDQKVYYEDALAILNLIYENPGIIKYFGDALVNIEERKELFKQMVENADNNFINFHFLLLDIGSGNAIKAILDGFIDLVNNDLGIIQGKIITTVKLDDKTVKIIEGKMSKILDIDVQLEPEIDNEILGGIIVTIKDRV
jgi:F-type H+-transporting ATPase subunit delta